MSMGRRFLSFCDRNVVLISGVGIICGIHWMWWKLQNNPALVSPSEKKEFPILTGVKYLGRKITDEYHHMIGETDKKADTPK